MTTKKIVVKLSAFWTFLNLQLEVVDIAQDNPINFLAMGEGTTLNVRGLSFCPINTKRLGSDLIFIYFRFRLLLSLYL